MSQTARQKSEMRVAPRRSPRPARRLLRARAMVAGEQEEADQLPANLHSSDSLPTTCGGALGGRPWAGHPEEHCTSAIRRGLGLHSNGRAFPQRALPRRALVGVGARYELRFRGTELGERKARGGEQLRPHGVSRPGGRAVAEGRHAAELDESSRIVEHDRGHAGDRRGRVAQERNPFRCERHERVGARPIPEQHRWHLTVLQGLPAGRRRCRCGRCSRGIRS